MARKPRDYKAEYARRKELHKGDIAAARGHRSKEWESMERRVRKMYETKAPWENFDPKTVYDEARRHGVSVVDEALDVREQAAEAWSVGDSELAHRVWEARNPDLPDWLYHYHGFFL